MYITKYEIDSDVFYRIGEKRPTGTVTLKGGNSNMIQEQTKNRFDSFVQKMMSEKVEKPVEEEIKSASIVNVIRSYASALKEK